MSIACRYGPTSSDESGKLQSELELSVANSSVISYLQVGRPETILIDSAKRIERQLHEYDV